MEILEYQVFELDPRYLLSRLGPPLYQSDNLQDACIFAERTHSLLMIETCVWQPRTAGYRDYYRN